MQYEDTWNPSYSVRRLPIELRSVFSDVARAFLNELKSTGANGVVFEDSNGVVGRTSNNPGWYVEMYHDERFYTKKSDRKETSNGRKRPISGRPDKTGKSVGKRRRHNFHRIRLIKALRRISDGTDYDWETDRRPCKGYCPPGTPYDLIAREKILEILLYGEESGDFGYMPPDPRVVRFFKTGSLDDCVEEITGEVSF
ncbi:MAG: hypothetical protein Q8Q42_00875 [Nanoarchaeota archaeon]|nr:hypothetical protein [Nanoarchaeota archaeon]